MSCGPMNFMWVIITIVTITHQAHISPIKVMHHPTIIYLQASQPRLLLIHNLLPTSHSPSPSLTLIFSSLSLPTLPTSLVLSCGNYVHIVSYIFWWRWGMGVYVLVMVLSSSNGDSNNAAPWYICWLMGQWIISLTNSGLIFCFCKLECYVVLNVHTLPWYWQVNSVAI
jgi:hypothetical protein